MQPPRPFFATLLGMPELTPQARQLIAAEAGRRIGWGTQAIAAGHIQLETALASADTMGARLAAETVRDAMRQIESGSSALQAIAQGAVPQQLALTWFRGELGIGSPDPVSPGPAHGDGLWGLSWYHVTTMAALLATLIAAVTIQFLRIRRIEGLLRAAPPTSRASLPAPSISPRAELPVIAPARASERHGTRSNSWRGRLHVAAIFSETPDVKTFRLKEPSGADVPFEFKPGQFLTVTVEVQGKKISRSYTIASAPTRRDHVEITVKREEHGEVSRHLHDAISVGDPLEISGPAGVFTFNGDEAGDIVLIAGGVGITPMMSVIRTLTDRAWTGEIHLLYGARTTRDFIFRDELEYLQRRHANLHVVATMRRAEGTSWMGPEGVITKDFIARSVPEIARRRIHLCGPPPMMAAVKTALAELGVPPANIRTEAFGPARGQETPVAADARKAPAVVAPAATAAATVTFSRSGKSAPLGPNQTVLEAAESVGVAIDFSCRTGICGTCMVPLRSGAVTMAVEDGLPLEEKAKGMILACQAKSTGDVVVEA